MPSLRTLRRAACALLIGGLVGGLLVAAPPGAYGLPGSTFESTDGNLVANGGVDWATVGIVCDSTSDNCVVDKPTGSGDDALGQGSKDDHQTMTVVNGSIPNNKSDLTRLYVESETVGTDVYVYLAWQRTNTLGTANFSFELNQLVQPDPPEAGGPWALRRLAGDVLVLFDFTSGGKADKLVLSASKWVTAGNAKKDCQASNTVPCWGKVTNLSNLAFADGAVNKVEISDPISGATLPALTFGEAAVNLSAANLIDGCRGFGSVMVRSRSSAAFNSELKDFIAPLDTAIQPPHSIAGALASGRATAAVVNGTALPPDNADTPDEDEAIRVSTQRSGTEGAGTTTASEHLLEVNQPADGSQLHAGLLHVSSASTVTPAPAGAEQLSVARVVDVDVLDGVVTADAVRAVATAEADTSGSTYGSLGSSFENLEIDIDGPAPQPPVSFGNDVAPNTTVGLSSLVFGPGSFVKLYDTSGSVTPLPPGAQVGDPITWEADVTVRMIWVHVTDSDPLTVGDQTVDVYVSEAEAHAEFATTICSLQEVSGNATILRERTNPDVAPVTVGFVQIPRLGGHAHQHLVEVGVNGSTIEVADSDSTGAVVIDTSSTASSYAEAAGVCLLPGVDGCTVSATLVRSQANSSATADSRTSDATGTQFVGLSVAGNAVGGSPDPNTRIDLPAGLGYVILNEQVCGDGTLLSGGDDPVSTCGADASGKTALTVTAIRLVLLPDQEGGPLGEIVVAEAHSDARFPLS